MGMMMETKYFVDADGNYKGSFTGETGIDTSAWIEVSVHPQHASQKWLGDKWAEYLEEE